MQKIYFTTGEFAKLCSTTKATLFHYDSIGLLKPECTAENGYRYYSSEQIFTYDVISSLKSVGTRLTEIKEYMENKDGLKFKKLLKQKQKQLAEKQKKMALAQKLLTNTITDMEAISKISFDKINLIYCEEEYLITSETKVNDVYNLKVMQTHMEYCKTNNLYDYFFIGEIIAKEDFINNNFMPSYISSKIDKKVNNKKMIVKPAGTYVEMYHKGSYSSLPSSYQKLKLLVEENNYTPIGDVYETDKLYFLTQSSLDEYIMRIVVQIEKNN